MIVGFLKVLFLIIILNGSGEIRPSYVCDWVRVQVFENFESLRVNVYCRYEPLFDYFKEFSDVAFRVIADNYVTSDSGTGIVHCAPAFGEDDYRVCIENQIINKVCTQMIQTKCLFIILLWTIFGLLLCKCLFWHGLKVLAVALIDLDMGHGYNVCYWDICSSDM